jgi:hypothetical protein
MDSCTTVKMFLKIIFEGENKCLCFLFFVFFLAWDHINIFSHLGGFMLIDTLNSVFFVISRSVLLRLNVNCVIASGKRNL